MKLVATLLLATLASFVATRVIAHRLNRSTGAPPITSPVAAVEGPQRAPAPAQPTEPDAARISRELAHRSAPLLLPPRPFEPDGSVSLSLARLLGLNPKERSALNDQLREIAQQATQARIRAAKLVASSDDRATVCSLRQSARAEELERAYTRTFSEAVGAQHRGWIEQQEALVTQAAQRATGYLGATDTTWIVQKVGGPTPAVPARYLLITISAKDAENTAQSSTPFDQLESVEPIAREVLQRNLPATFLANTP